MGKENRGFVHRTPQTRRYVSPHETHQHPELNEVPFYEILQLKREATQERLLLLVEHKEPLYLVVCTWAECYENPDIQPPANEAGNQLLMNLVPFETALTILTEHLWRKHQIDNIGNSLEPFGKLLEVGPIPNNTHVY